MPKIKSHSASKKRFSLTATGKVKCAHMNKRHILTKKSAKRKRQLRACAYADTTTMATVKTMIPYK